MFYASPRMNIAKFPSKSSFNNTSKIDLPKGTELIDCQVNIKSTLLDNSIDISKAVELRVKLDIIGGKDMVLSFKFIDGDISLQRKFRTFDDGNIIYKIGNLELFKLPLHQRHEVLKILTSYNNNGNRINNSNNYILENFDMEINSKEMNQLNQIMAEDLNKN
ncbi:hypothetical protein ACTA71_001944 [Dictyostelium dimigraforme]